MVFAIAIWAIFKCLLVSTKKKVMSCFLPFRDSLPPRFLLAIWAIFKCLLPAWEPPPPAPPSGILQGASQASRSFPGLQRASSASLPPPPAPPSESRQGASESRPPEPCSEEQVHGKEGLNLQPARMQPARMQPVSANATATPPQLVEESLQALPRDEGPTHIFYAHVLQRF